MASYKVDFNGKFNVQDIITSIDKVYAEIKKNNKVSLVDVDRDMQKIKTLAATIQAQLAKGFTSGADVKAVEANFKKLETEAKKLGVNMNKVGAGNLEKVLEEIGEKFKDLKKQANEAEKAFAKSLSGKSGFKKSDFGVNIDNLKDKMLEAAKAGKELVAAQKEIEKEYGGKRRGIINNSGLSREAQIALRNGQNYLVKSGLSDNRFTGDANSSIDLGNGKSIKKWAQAYQDAMALVTASTKNGQDAFEAFVGKIGESNIKNIDGIKKVFGDEKTLGTATQKQVEYLQNLQQLKDLQTELEGQQDVLISKTNEYNKVKSSSKDLDAQMRKEKEDAINENERYKDSVRDMNDALEEYINTGKQEVNISKQTVDAQEALNKSLDNIKSRIGYIFSLGNAYYQLRNILKQTLNDVNDIDKAFASIAMVTEKTVDGLWEHYTQYATLAQKLGQSTESAVKTSALFYQQGLKDAEVMRLTEDTMKLATLAGLDFEKATSQMTAAIRGFHMEMEESSHVTDVYSELAAHAAADVNGIAYAMSKTASIASNAGMSFENTAAFLTQMIETTQEAPENIGTALKTIIARFTELKKNVAGTAESEFEDLDYNKVDTALKSVGVQLKDVNGQFRNLDDVFMELSSKWNTLDRNSQRYIATIAAGSRQQSRFIAMMENYSRLRELVAVTEDAEGRANEQFAKNAESLQFKLQSLKTAWEQLRLSFADSDFFKDIVDGLTKLVNLIGKMDKKQLAIVATIGIVMGKLIIDNLIQTIQEGTGRITTALKTGVAPSFKEIFKSNLGYLQGAQEGLFSAFGDPDSLVTFTNKDTERLQILEREAQIYQQIINEIQEMVSLDQEDNELNSAQLRSLGEKARNQNTYINKLMEELGLEEKITAQNVEQLNTILQENSAKNPSYTGLKGFLHSEAGQTLAQGGKAAASAAVTTAVMTALSGADLETVIKTSATTALMSIIPSVISAVGPTIAGALSGPAGWAALIVAAVIGTVAIIKKKIDEVREAEVERLASVKKANEDLLKSTEESILNSEKNQKEADKLELYQKYIEKYSDKTFLTNEETNRLKEAQEYISENYEDAYTEDINGHFQLIEGKMDTIIAEMRDDKNDGEIYTNTKAREFNAISLLNEIEKTRDKEINVSNQLFGKSMAYSRKTIEDLFAVFGEDIPEEYKDLLDSKNETIGAKRVNELLDILEEKEQDYLKEIKRSNAEVVLKKQGYTDEEALMGSYLYPELRKNVNEDLKATLKKTNLTENLANGTLYNLGNYEDTVRKTMSLLGYEDISEFFKSGTNAKKFEDLTDEMKIALRSVGVDPKDWDSLTNISKGRKKASYVNDVLAKIISNYAINSNDIFEDEYKELYKESHSIYTKYKDAQLDYANKSYSEYIRDLDKALTGLDKNSDVYKSIQEYAQSEDAVSYKWQQARKTLLGHGFNSETLNNMTYEATQEISTALGEYGEAAARQIANYLNNAGLSKIDYSILGKIDLEDLSAIGVDGAKQYVDALINAGHSADEAQRIFNDYVNAMRLYTHQRAYFGVDSVGILRENIKTYTDGLEEQFQTLHDAEKEMLEKGFVTRTTANKAKDAGFGDLLEKSANGWIIKAKEAQEAYRKAAIAGKKYIEGEIEAQKAFIEEAESYMYDKRANEILQRALADDEEARELYLSNLATMGEENYASFVKKVIDAGFTDFISYTNSLRAATTAMNQEANDVWYDYLININDQYNSALEKLQDLRKEQAELEKEMKKNEEDVADAWEKYQEALYGTKLYRSSLDDLINFNNELDNTERLIETITSDLQESESIATSSQLYNSLSDNYNKRIANLTAQNVIRQQSMANIRDVLTSQYGDYVTFNGDQLSLNHNYQTMEKNDEIKKTLEAESEKYWGLQKEVYEAEKQKREYRKLWEEQKKEGLKKYVDIQENVISVLKEAAEEEVQITKDKYDALKEADDDYLDALEDAISKQRALRDMENQEEDLAQKQKKLSLMARDTSGANAKDIKSLEEEVAKDRQDLLDKNVDNIIDSMKELYEKQAEARDAEIEYMEAVTENAQYFADWASSIMSSWQSSEDMVDWFMQNDKQTEDMTVEQQELYIQDLQDKWTDLVNYQGLKLIDFQENADEIEVHTDLLLNNLTENSTSTAQYLIDNANKVAEEQIKSAKEAYDDAVDKMNKTKEEYKELLTQISTADQLAAILHGQAMADMVDASKSAIEEVSVLAAKVLIENSGLDVTDEAEMKSWAKEHNFYNEKTDTYSQSFINAVGALGGDTSAYSGAGSYKIQVISDSGNVTTMDQTFDTKEEAQDFIDKNGIKGHIRIAKETRFGDIVDNTYDTNYKFNPDAYLHNQMSTSASSSSSNGPAYNQGISKVTTHNYTNPWEFYDYIFKSVNYSGNPFDYMVPTIQNGNMDTITTAVSDSSTHTTAVGDTNIEINNHVELNDEMDSRSFMEALRTEIISAVHEGQNVTALRK